jgi:hypothetical protein
MKFPVLLSDFVNPRFGPDFDEDFFLTGSIYVIYCKSYSRNPAQIHVLRLGLCLEDEQAHGVHHDLRICVADDEEVAARFYVMSRPYNTKQCGQWTARNTEETDLALLMASCIACISKLLAYEQH